MSERDADPLTNWQLAIRQLGDRLERDYVARVTKVARGFGIWGSSTEVGYEIPLGGRIGRLDGKSARYARKTGPLGLFGRRVLVRDLADIEREFRLEIESWLRDREDAQKNSSD
jgi:hypothetical protein